MIGKNVFAKDANQVGYFEPSLESELFAKRLVSAISKGSNHISLTLTEKGAVAFARELSERLLAEKAQKHDSDIDKQEELIPKSEVMKMLSVSSTTLWLWNNNKYLPQVNIGRKVFYRAEDIQKLRRGNANEDSDGNINI